MAVKGDGSGVWAENVQVTERYKPLVIKRVSHRGVVQSTLSIVNNIKTLYDDKWLLDLSWWSPCKVHKCQITMLNT